MLTLTQLAGFGSGGGGGTDAIPAAINFNDISDAGLTASVGTNVVTILGIDTTITLRLSLSANMSAQRTVGIYRDNVLLGQGASGSAVDVTMANGQTLQYSFTNALNNTTWSGTATVSNLSDGGAVLDTFAFTLQDTGSEAVVTL